MTGRNLNEWERETLRNLLRLVEDRAAAEQACREKYESAKLEANREVARARKTIAADRAFANLPVLGDALEEAGCTDAELLDHCRNPGEHGSGCWAVNQILGKE